MKKNNNEVSNKVKTSGKTKWDKVISQTNSDVLRNANTDPDSPILNNKNITILKRRKLNNRKSQSVWHCSRMRSELVQLLRYSPR